jgi:hypothetical protein
MKNNPDAPKRPVGRPPQGGPTPQMQLGRVSAEDRATLRDAAKRAGKSFTEWALDILLRAAKKR